MLGARTDYCIYLETTKQLVVFVDGDCGIFPLAIY